MGAWLCARLLAGDLQIEQVVPEGHDDLSCEGGDNWHVQVKSRQTQRGDFTNSQVAAHVLEVARHHAIRVAARVPGRPVLVLERPVDGWAGGDWGVPLDAVAGHEPLLEALRSAGERRGITPAQVAAISSLVSVVVLPWQVAAHQAREVVSARHGLPAGATVPVVLALRDRVAACVDVNAGVDLSERAFLDRTTLEHVVSQAVAMVDRASLEEALALGACEPVDFETAFEPPGFFEGVDVQPGHIAAGLPAPRPVVTGAVVTGLLEGRAVLVTGPSGVGKSTVMWAAAYSTRHVLWYRVRRLRDADVEPLVRLARAAGASQRSPVGFVVDGVGVGAAQAWDLLQRELDAVPGTVLLGSARTEDLLPLRTLPSTEVVDVRLDEDMAAQIHAGLSASGVVVVPHWREAYEQSGGLTMEFTHLLTSGRRLRDVVTDQVNRRVAEGRETELRVLALVATAHRWSATLTLDAVRDQVGAPAPDLREALRRLADEHLIHVSGEHLTGLHQLRSSALSAAVHQAPPPSLRSSVGSVLSLIDDRDLRPFVVGVLTDYPDLDDFIVSLLAKLVRERPGSTVLAAALHALRFVDFAREAAAWAKLLDRHGIQPAYRPITLDLAMIRSDLGEYLRPEIVAAVGDLRARGAASYVLRDQLLSDLGPDVVVNALSSADDIDTATGVLATCGGADPAVAAKVGALLTGSGFDSLLGPASAEQLGDILSVSRDWSLELARSLFDAAGGHEGVAAKLRQHSPYLIGVEVDDRCGCQVAVARLMHLSDTAIADIDAYVRQTASVVLRCFPACERVDVQARLAGDVPIQVGDLVLGRSGLERRYDHPPMSVAWNRIRSQVAAAAAGVMDATTRAVTVRDLVVRTNGYLEDAARSWCTGRLDDAAATRLEARRVPLRAGSASLSLPVSRTDLMRASAEDGLAPGGNDQVHSLVSGIVDSLTSRLFEQQPAWGSLAGYVGDQLRDSVRQVRTSERWDLSGQPAPSELERLEAQLTDLHAVLAELAWGDLSMPGVRAAARTGPYDRAISRVADVARAAAGARFTTAVEELQAAAATQGVRLHVGTRIKSSAKAADWPALEMAVGVHVATLEEWLEALPVVVELLRSDQSARGRGKCSVLILPLIGQRPVRALTFMLNTNLWPQPDEFDPWKDDLPAPHPTPLYDAVLQAHHALQGLSGLAELTRHRDDTATLQGYADQEVARLNEPVAAISDLTERQTDDVLEAIIDELAELSARVQAEIDDGPGDESLAAGMAMAVRSGSSADHATFDAMLTMSLRWDLDPAEAVRVWNAPDVP